MPGFAGPETFAEFLQLRLNHPQQWARLQRDHDTLLKIDQKPWTPEFKQKAVETFLAFQAEGIEISDHGVARFLSRCNGEKGFPPYTVKEIAMQIHMPINYRQDDGRVIRFYNERAVVSTPDRIVVSVINRKYPKEGWRDINDTSD